jgi:hypothetical protein
VNARPRHVIVGRWLRACALRICEREVGHRRGAASSDTQHQQSRPAQPEPLRAMFGVWDSCLLLRSCKSAT